MHILEQIAGCALGITVTAWTLWYCCTHKWSNNRRWK